MNKALLSRRTILGRAMLLLGAVGLTVPATATHASPGITGSVPDLQPMLDELAKRAQPGALGATVLDLKTGQSWGVNADHAFPMMSVFKAPLGAAVLSKADAGEISLQQKITITRADLRLGASKIADDFKGDSMTFTVASCLPTPSAAATTRRPTCW